MGLPGYALQARRELDLQSYLSKDFVHILCVVESREILLNPFGSWT